MFLIIGFFLLQGCSSEKLSPIAKDQSIIFTVNTFASSISFIDEKTATILTTWELDFPVQRATLLDEDHLLLYGRTIPEIYVYELSTGKKVATWRTEHGIFDIGIDHKRAELYATSSDSNEVLTLDSEGNILQKITVSEKPQSLIMSDDKLIVLNFGNDMISIIDLETKQVTGEWKGPEHAIDGAVASQNNEIWIGGHGKGSNIEHNISIYDLSDGTLLKQISAPIMPVIFENVDDHMFVLSHGSNQLRKIDIYSREIIGVAEVGANPFAMASRNQKLYIAGYDSNDLSIVDAQSLKTIAVLPVGDGPIQVLIRAR